MLLSQESQKMRQVVLIVSFVLSVAAENSAQSSIKKIELSREAFDPCNSGNYQTLNSSDRLVGNTDQRSLKCDKRDLIRGWYRFTGDAGDKMPNRRPTSTRRCGTHAPGWIDGGNPSVAAGEVTRKVCYYWSGVDCRWNNNIKVKNCGAFFVYKLRKPPVCWLRYCGEASECSNYTSLDQSDRAVGNTDQSNLKCDKWAPDNIVSGWYRMTGASGDQIPEGCVPIRRCGTHAPGWLNDTHPTVKDGLLTAKVCYHWSNKCCRWSNNIKIRNCGSYYVYQLVKPPVCYLRYCGNKNAPLTTSPAPTTAAFDPCTSGNYQTLSSSDRLVSNTNQSSLKCDRYTLIPGWYRFTGDAGDGMPSYCPPIRRCGTHATGWLNGSYPTLAEGAVTRKVCYHWSNKCCRWSNNIKIKNCNGYYVYRLAKPPACHLRYCGNGQGAPLTTSPAPTTAAFDPCTSGNYQTLSSSDRLVSNTNQSSLKCDRYTLIPGWYRFTGDAGDGMPSYCPPIRRCGTHATGWLNGSYPTLAEGAVTRKVCYHWSNKCCRWSNNIKIKNCNGYYVYRLAKPPACHLRYCGNGQGAPLTTSPAPTTAAFDPCTSGNYQTLSSSDRLVSNTNQSSLKCDRYTLIPGWYRFTGDAGDGMPSYCPPIRRCGTHATGWLNGSYPTLAEGAVTREVCYHWSNKCCRWSNNIKIKNCNGYYVYRLAKPPACHLRYCGNGQGAPLTTSPAPTTAAFDPCTSGNYQTLSSSDRLVSNTNQSSLKCDRYTLIPGWYRFTGDAGDGMPSYCPPIRRCGTHATGWLNGSYPTLAEGAVTREVCYHWSNKCCRWSNNIKIKNCNGYYVYRLAKPPACHLRYCGNGQGAPLTTSPAPTTAAFDPCTSGNYQTLSSSDRLVSNTNQSSLKCDRYTLIPGWYRFTGDAGDGMPSYCPPIRRCGTHATGWLNGSYPTLAEGAVTRKVCYHWSNKCCRWSNNIKIKNCNGYYVYQLAKPPTCHLRYCGNGQPQKTSPATTQLFTTPSSYTSVPANPPGQQEVNVTCGNNEMWINLPKSLLSGLDRDHLRLLDANCGAEETRTQFILYTKLTECETISKHTRGFVLYSNKVLQIPLKKKRIITRVREVEIPFSCYYSNTGVVSAVGIKVQSKKILFSKKGFGRFVLEMNIFPDNRYVGFYGKKDFPLIVSLRKLLYVQVKVESEDKRLAIIAEECFATPDANPLKPGLKYMFIKDGCAVDETVAFIPSGNEHLQRYSIEAFTFLGDHEFVYMHCRVKICNATDTNSRCAQGCIPQRGRRSALKRRQSEDDEANLAAGPFTRKHEDGENSQLQETERELKDTDKTETGNEQTRLRFFGSTISVAITAMTVVSSIGVLFLLYFVYDMRKQRQFNQENSPLSVPVHD
ncbi:uncharacterized protein LOC141881766 isoform X1 [Acropora palmata]|uniref:uncharacterized protein LOC141881766 isoform X1 n=1 Tax=Acropora palmata TaxID=6131 RepID=UPI003D9FCFB8